MFSEVNDRVAARQECERGAPHVTRLGVNAYAAQGSRAWARWPSRGVVYGRLGRAVPGERRGRRRGIWIHGSHAALSNGSHTALSRCRSRDVLVKVPLGWHVRECGEQAGGVPQFTRKPER